MRQKNQWMKPSPLPKRISFDELRKLFPNAGQSFLTRNSVVKGTSAANAQPIERSTLVRASPRDGAGCGCDLKRLKIVFTIRSRRPADWDGYHIKELQDVLVHAGILADDSWDLLQGEVISEKVHKVEEEGTLITIVGSGS